MRRFIGFGCLAAVGGLVATLYRLDGAPGEAVNNLARLAAAVGLLLIGLVCLVGARRESRGRGVSEEIKPEDLPGWAQYYRGVRRDEPNGSGFVGASGWEEMRRLEKAKPPARFAEPVGKRSAASRGQGNGAAGMRSGQSVVNGRRR